MTETENSNWIVQVHAALERDVANDVPSKLLIWKVPSNLRTNIEHYKPMYWRFGLHHCPQSIHSNDIEPFKVKVARELQFTGDQWDSFCEQVVLEPKEHWEAMYCQSPHANSYTIEEIRCRLSLDALFMVVILQHWGSGLNPGELQKVLKNPILQSCYDSWDNDVCLVENQIPMELLERVVCILVRDCKDHVGEMCEWESDDWQVWNIINCVKWIYFYNPLLDDFERVEVFKRRVNDVLQHLDFYRGVHILDSTYRMLCGWESLEATYEKLCPQICSATDLEACRVTIKGKEFTCFEDISFEKGYLSIPFLTIYDSTEKYLRNFVVYEGLPKHDGRERYAARCYTNFMGGLMRSQEDVILLEKRGVVSVEVGSYDTVVDMWKRINSIVAKAALTNNFFKMMTDVRNYTKRRRNKYRFEFKKQFCSRPWIPLSYLAATIVTTATLIQTYIAIIGSDRMKPHFAPQH